MDDPEIEIVRVDREVDASLRPGLLASLDGLWTADSRRFDPVVDPGWPGSGGDGYLTSVAEDDDALLLAAVAGGAAVGHLVGRFAAADGFRRVPVAVLESMQVVASRRGGGAGAALVAAFVAWGRERGAHVLSVTATAQNAGARRFYAAHGFAEQSVTHRRWLVPPPEDAVVG